MVYLFLGRYISKIVGENHNMDSYRRVVETHAGITATPTITGGWSLPDMTRTSNSIYLITQVDNS